MIDEGELDWKIVAISLDDPRASLVNDVNDVEKHFPGTLMAIRDWFRDYKIPDGKLASKFGLGNKAANKDDPELEAIRQRRMQELMSQHGMGSQQNAGQQKAQEDAKREAEERRQLMLSQILSAQARERCKIFTEAHIFGLGLLMLM